ncbi:hypothetical protein FACS1894163_05350 [Spirochaetia bacterium]|nr:hypothetical protein FACS1894163_05350 [Spirochaetia bacterium]
MIGFLIKKTFFDLWDNLFRVALLNLGFIASLAIPVFLPGLLLSIPPLSIAVMAIGILWCSVYLSAAAMALRHISDYGAFGFGDLPGCLKQGWPSGILVGIAVFVVYLLATMIIPFYLGIASLFGLLLAAVIFWTMAVCVISLQFFFAIRARLDTKLSKVFKKCFVFFFDNPGFCVFSFIHNLVLLALSGLLAFLFPGPAGILLYLDEALRLRLLKYDWLEENPPIAAEGASKPKRPQIPWDALLIDDRDRTGTRSFKSFIFPWKD